MSRSSYEEVMKHLLCLKMENTHLRREIRDNSSHLTKLEIDASTMKDRLAHHLHQAVDSGRVMAEMVPAAGDSMVNFAMEGNNEEFGATATCETQSDEYMEEQNWTPLPPNASGCFVASPFASETSSRMDASGPRSSQNLLVTASVPSVHGRAVVTEPSVGDEHLVFAQTELEGKTGEYNTEGYVALSDNQCNLDGHSGSAKLVTIATQTSDVYLPNSAPLVQDSNDWHQSPGNQNLSALYHGGWPLENGSQSDGIVNPPVRLDTASVMSFTSSNVSSSTSYRVQHHQLGTKVEMVYSLLSMLGTHDKDDMSRTLLAMSNSQDSCIAMRQSGCLPLLIQLLHGNNKDMHLLGNTRGTREARTRAAKALRNIVHSNPDNKSARREARVLRLLEQIRAHCDQLRSPSDEEVEKQLERSGSADIDHHHPGPAIAALMKLSFDEEHRHAICNLGGLQAIVELLQLDAEVNGNTVEQYNITMRRYACMALTNLTFGDGTNKALLCSYKGATRALVSQLCSPNEDLCQVAASVLRNLSWRADLASKKVLREVGSVVALMEAAMAVEKESTLKSILSALWNLSAHCSENKEDICAVDGALKFLVGTLTYQSPSKTLAVVENGGGILRNISSHIAVCEEYRTVLRQHDCLQILLHHLESSSLTIVSNACGTLWNLSARCAEDQQMLWDLGAVNKLRNLIQSKHKMISMGSAAALKNLLSARPEINAASDDRMLAVVSPGLHVRRQRALEAELEVQELSETCENIEGFHSRPTRSRSQDSHVAAKLSRVLPVGGDAPHAVSSFNQSSFESSARPETRLNVGRSESQDSVGSTHSDISHDRMRMPSQLIKKPHTSQAPLEGPERRMSEENRLGLEALASSQKLGRLMQMMHEAKVHAGLQPGDYVHDGYLGKGPHSLESSPASHRRWQEGVGRYTNIGKHVAYLSSADEAMSFTHLSPCMENLHLTMPELDQDQDEPINFSTKYVEVPQDPTIDPVPQLSKPSKHPARVADVQSTSTQLVHGQRKVAPIQDVGGGVPLANPQAFASGVAPGRSVPQVTAGRSATSIRPVRSASAVMTGRSAPPVAPGLTAPIRPQSIIKPALVPNSAASVNAVGFVGKAMYTRNGHPHVQGRVMSSFSGYGKAELDVEQPTNYSIQFAECDDEDEEPSFAEEPINYSTRYTEHETTSHVGYSLPGTQCATSGFNDDTVTTFCTEGTPMNFLSTATSMNDLSCRGTTMAQRKVEALMVPKVGSKETAERIKSHSDAECSSISGSQSTDHHTASTVVVEKQPEEVKSGQVSAADNVFLEGQSSRSGQVPSIYSYNDSTGASSPCDKPKQYCTEGTPMCFSHSSSLSSLQIPEVSEEDLPGKQVLLPKPGICLPDIDENSPLDVMNPDETTVMTSRMTAEGGAAAASSASGHHATTKTVTFDDNNQIQIQETPLMFSRCSSLGSLSSFDTHSVHSSVVSEYSRRASEVVSPSDLPDSPCNTMPPSPSYKSSTTKFSSDPQEVEKTGMESQPKKPGVDSTRKLTSCPARDNNQTVLQLPSAHQASGMQVLTSGQNCEFSEQSSPVAYADEGSVCGISGGTSLSALTLDDDAEIPRRLSRRIKPLGEENEKVSMPSTDGNARELIKTAELNVDDDDNSSVSEGEENMLAECISLAMPSKSSKRMVHSCSDGLIKQKEPMARRDACANRGMSCSKIITSPSLGVMSEAKVTSFADRQRNAYHAVTDVVDASGCDSPRKYATEDTPLNFSHCGSLGDLSADSSNLANTTVRFIEKPETKPTVDDNSDVSSLSDSNENYEDLLFEVIEAAMPKSKKPWKPSSSKNAHRLEGSGTKATPPKAASRNPVAHLLKSGAQGVRSMNGYSFLLSSTSAEMDGVKTYAVEGTPIEFSRSTSLSNLTIESMDGADKDRAHVPSTKSQGAESRPHPPGEQQSIAVRNPTFHGQNLASEDVMHSYGIEDTPAVFSRNDSLSSLSGAEDEEVMRGGSNRGAVQGVRGIKPVENTIRDKMVSRTPAAGRTSLQSPTVARLRTPCTAGLRIFSSGTNLTSTPVNKQMRSPIGGQEDQVVQYAVEGTPENISRNLSPTPRFTVSHNRNLTDPEPDQSACFLVEGTPAQFSCNSSLSSLSLESFSFEPTPSEAALLEECINAAMPKSKKRAKKSELPQTSPLRGSKPSIRRSLVRETSYNDVKGDRIPQMKTPSLVEPRTAGKHERTEKRFKENNDVQTKRPDVAGFAGILQTSGNLQSHRDNRQLAIHPSEAHTTKETPSPPTLSGHRLADSSILTSTPSATGVAKVSLPEHKSSALLDLTSEDDNFLSGPSTGANNTVIYHGPQISDIPEVVNAEVDKKEYGSKELSAELETTTDLEQRNNTLNDSADVIDSSSCRLHNTFDESCSSQLEEDAKIVLSELSNNCKTPNSTLETCENDLFAEDSSILLDKEADSGSDPECGAAGGGYDDTNTRQPSKGEVQKGACIVKLVNRNTIRPQGVTKSVTGKRKLLTAQLLIPPSSSRTREQVGRVLGSSPNDRVKAKTSTPPSGRSPAGKSRSLSPAVRSQTSAKVFPGARTPVRSNSTNGVRNQPLSIAVGTDDSTVRTVPTAFQKPGGPKVSPQVPPRTSSQLSMKSSASSSPSSPKVGSLDSVKPGVSPLSKTSNMVTGKGLKTKTEVPKPLTSPSAVSPVARTTGIPRRVAINKPDPPLIREEKLESAVAVEAAQMVERPKPPIKQGTFTKELSSSATVPSVNVVSCAVRTEGVGKCSTAECDVDSTTKTPVSSDLSSSNQMPETKAEDFDATKVRDSINSSIAKTTDLFMDNMSDITITAESSSLGNESERRMPLKNLSESQPSMTSILSTIPMPRKSSLASGSDDSALPTECAISQKKQGFGKLSSFWLRDKKPKVPSEKVPAVQMDTTNRKKSDGIGAGKSPKSFRKSFPVGRSKKGKKDEAEGEESVAVPCDGIVRSRTYDKILEKSITLENAKINFEVAEDDMDAFLWRRTYTLEEGEKMTETSSAHETKSESNALEKRSDGKEGKKTSLSLWKRHSKDSSKENTKEKLKDGSKAKDGSKEKDSSKEKLKDVSKKSKDNSRDKSKEKSKENLKADPGDGDAKPEPPKKKGFSLWRREDSSKKGKNKELSSKETMNIDCAIETGQNPVETESPIDSSSFQGDGTQRTGSSSPSRSHTPPSPVIPPFNCVPTVVESGIVNIDSSSVARDISGSRHTTKTEMLLARRQQAFQKSDGGVNNGESEEDSTGSNKPPCLVTTV